MTAIRAYLSDRVVIVDDEARPKDVTAQIQAHDSTHAAVFAQEKFRGIVRLQDALQTSPDRIFADLLPASPPPIVGPEASSQEINEMFSRANTDALAVAGADARFIGIVTRETLLNRLFEENKELLEEKAKLLERSEGLRSLVDEDRARLQAILETAVDAIITIDAGGIIESFNQAAQKMFGYSADELLGENIKMLMPAGFRDIQDDCLKGHQKCGERLILGKRREVTGKRKDDTTFQLSFPQTK